MKKLFMLFGLTFCFYGCYYVEQLESSPDIEITVTEKNNPFEGSECTNNHSRNFQFENDEYDDDPLPLIYQSTLFLIDVTDDHIDFDAMSHTLSDALKNDTLENVKAVQHVRMYPFSVKREEQYELNPRSSFFYPSFVAAPYMNLRDSKVYYSPLEMDDFVSTGIRFSSGFFEDIFSFSLYECLIVDTIVYPVDDPILKHSYQLFYPEEMVIEGSFCLANDTQYHIAPLGVYPRGKGYCYAFLTYEASRPIVFENLYDIPPPKDVKCTVDIFDVVKDKPVIVTALLKEVKTQLKASSPCAYFTNWRRIQTFCASTMPVKMQYTRQLFYPFGYDESSQTADTATGDLLYYPIQFEFNSFYVGVWSNIEFEENMLVIESECSSASDDKILTRTQCELPIKKLKTLPLKNQFLFQKEFTNLQVLGDYTTRQNAKGETEYVYSFMRTDVRECPAKK